MTRPRPKRERAAVEALAMAIANRLDSLAWGDMWPEDRAEYRREARAEIAQLRAQGYAVVPITPRKRAKRRGAHG